MANMIAVWGSPESGKTTFSMKLAEALYNKLHGRCSIVIVFTDIVTPSLPVMFPNYKSEKLFSIGTILSKADFFADDIVSNMVMSKDYANLGYLGYKENENKYSFPEYTEAKAKYFYEILGAIADYIIVDCMAMPDANNLTKVALENADKIIRLSTPDLKGMSFYLSHASTFLSGGYLKNSNIDVINIVRPEFAISMLDVGNRFGNVSYIAPYSEMLAEQYMEAQLTGKLKDKKYMQIVRSIAEVI